MVGRRAALRLGGVSTGLAALLALALAPLAQGKAAPARTDARTALVQAERVLQHDRRWTPTSVYCLPPKRSAYHAKGVAGGTQTTFRCQWVKQNNSRPWEIDMVRVIYGSSGHYLESLVSSHYPPPLPRAALCTVRPVGHGVRARCHPTQ